MVIYVNLYAMTPVHHIEKLGIHPIDCNLVIFDYHCIECMKILEQDHDIYIYSLEAFNPKAINKMFKDNGINIKGYRQIENIKDIHNFLSYGKYFIIDFRDIKSEYYSKFDPSTGLSLKNIEDVKSHLQRYRFMVR